MRRGLLAILVVALSALFAACAAAPGSQLTGTTWQLSAYTEKVPAFQGVVPAEQQPHFTILFNSDSTFSATADCNQVAGNYTTSGSNITITPGPSTMAFCGEESLDAIYTHMLSTATSYAIADNQLTLTLSSEGTLVFNSATGSPAPADSPAVAESPATAPADATGGLLGKTWQLTAVTEKVPAFQGVIPDAEQTNYTITFNADGTFEAKADCNSVSGTYATADPTAASGDLSIFPGPSTLAACPEGSFDGLFTIGLGSAASYEVASDVLTMTLVNDGTLTFK
jgi:heat shock protein HslJ